jgi:hypothetical protein
MKKEIKNDPTKPFKRVYNYAIQRDVRYVDPTDIPKFHFLRSSLSRTQFITIHGLFQERVLPFVMCLLTGKTVGQYGQLLQHVKAHARRFTGRNFSPDKEVCDFEKALQSAVKTELQNTRICSCYFHFCKSLWRRVSDLGLSTPYGRTGD